MFAPWVEAVAKALRVGLPRTAALVDQEYLIRLTTPRPEILIQEDRRISEGLTKNPLSVKLHEEAALLIGSVAIREATLDFMDARPALNAMSAHLAMAKASGGDLSATGELAEAVLCSLAGRQAAALEIIDRLRERAGAPNEMPLETATRWEERSRFTTRAIIDCWTNPSMPRSLSASNIFGHCAIASALRRRRLLP